MPKSMKSKHSTDIKHNAILIMFEIEREVVFCVELA